MDQEIEPVINEDNSESSIEDSQSQISVLSANFESQNLKLENRIKSLHAMLDDLRKELSREKELWGEEMKTVKKEIEHAEAVESVETVKAIVPMGSIAAEENFNSESRCLCCCGDSIKSENSSNTILQITEPKLSDDSILDYDKKLAVYKRNLIKTNAEKRLDLRKQLAASAYKRRINELENLCKLELQNVEQNVQTLQPLQAMVSEWNKDEDGNSLNLDDELIGTASIRKFKKDSLMAVENMEKQINSEINNIVTRVPSNFTSPNILSISQEDIDEDVLQKLGSLGWYWLNKKPETPF